LDGLEAIDRAIVLRALGDSSAHVRAAALRLSERWLSDRDPTLRQAVLKRTDDGSAVVRRQVALTLGELPDEQKVPELARLLARHGSDPIVVDAAISGLHGQELSVLRLGLQHEGPVDGGREFPANAITMLTAAAIRGGHDPDVTQTVEWIGDRRRPAAQRLALIEGIEAALGPSPSGAASDNTRAALMLRRRPQALIAAAAEGGALTERLTLLLPRIGWPGKPRARDTARPLTALEQQRFSDGGQLFHSICAPCHQSDGRGRDGVAPSLVGSKWVIGRPGFTARIVLNGKEGQMMMPPVALNDAQLAAVLTYMRRAWGHTAKPVDPGLVREVRGASTGRTRPWTEQELWDVTQPDGPPSAASAQ
jgi:mono/diheme cytochrome c family protein